MSVAFPFAANCKTPSARGPASFFLGTFRSPGVICGRSSCAAATTAVQADRAARQNAPPRTQCKILVKTSWIDAALANFALLGLAFSGEILMKVNDKAPDFTLQDENEKEVSLKALRGKTVVLFFYPKANTPG